MVLCVQLENYTKKHETFNDTFEGLDSGIGEGGARYSGQFVAITDTR